MKKFLSISALLVAGAFGAYAQDLDSERGSGEYRPEIALTDEAGFKYWIKSYVPFHAALANSNPVWYGQHTGDFDNNHQLPDDENYMTVGTGEYSGTAVIPETVKIGECTFAVTRIGYGAFADCHDLEEVVLPGLLMDIRRGAFYGCTSLRRVRQAPISEDKYYGTVLYPDIFRGCTSLESADISTATLVFDGIFRDCPSLKHIIMQTDRRQLDALRNRNAGTLETITCLSPYPFEGKADFSELEYATTRIIVPEGCVSAYRAHPVFGRFAHIEEDGSASVDQALRDPEINVAHRGPYRQIDRRFRPGHRLRHGWPQGVRSQPGSSGIFGARPRCICCKDRLFHLKSHFLR